MYLRCNLMVLCRGGSKYLMVLCRGAGSMYLRCNVMPGHPTTLAYGRAGPTVLAAGVGLVGYVFLFFLNLVYPIFLVGRQLDNLKYCGLGRSDPAVVVSYYRRFVR